MIVFTKYDLLVAKCEEDWEGDDDVDDETIKQQAREKAEERFQDICVAPLTKLFRHSTLPLFTKISSTSCVEIRNVRRLTLVNAAYPSYEKSMEELIDLTEGDVSSNASVWLSYVMAQRQSAALKVEGCIS